MSTADEQFFTCLHCRRTVARDELDAFEASTPWEAVDGSPSPLGATWIVREQAHNFALFSRHARSVRLLLFGPDDPATPIHTQELELPRNKTGPIWHCRVALRSAPSATHYAYCVTGPADDVDAGKVLLDPYAKSIFFPPGFDRGAAMRSGSNAGAATRPSSRATSASSRRSCSARCSRSRSIRGSPTRASRSPASPCSWAPR